MAWSDAARAAAAEARRRQAQGKLPKARQLLLSTAKRVGANRAEVAARLKSSYRSNKSYAKSQGHNLSHAEIKLMAHKDARYMLQTYGARNERLAGKFKLKGK